MNQSDQMRFIEISEPGGPEVLRIANGPRPKPLAGEVLIEVAAAGVNRPDVAQRMGFYPPPPGASPHPGLEVSGRVVETGEGVTWPQTGDKVCALVNGGGYAEFVTAPAVQCLPVPQGLSMVAAAALPETFFTVWVNVFGHGALKHNESLLVHGGTSGIGTTAIQLAKARGAKVYTTAGSDEKCQACTELGADLAINYKTRNFVDDILEATQGRGVDVVLDMVAGDYLNRNIAVAARGGRIVLIATLGGKQAEIDILPILMRSLVITGSVLRPRTAEEKGSIAAALLENVWPLIEAGDVAPVIHSTFPLAEVSKAHTLMETSAHIGKIVLEVNN
jgi:NADPH2:quinone reductase